MQKKYLWLIVISIVLSFLAVPLLHLLKTKWNQNAPHIEIPKSYSDDASQLNLTKVDTVIHVSGQKEEIKAQLKEVLTYAKTHHLKVSIAGARHSMGGHTINPNGIVLDMLPFRHMELDTLQNILSIGSGALWEDAITYLDRHGKSIAIMQAFSSFSVGGSISVNGHGWQKDLPPIAASVISFTLMKESGEIVTCSRDENQELFSLALGGYGLFGIILDIRLRVIDNVALLHKSLRLHPGDYVRTYKKHVSGNPNVDLAFGRLRISHKGFLEEASLTHFEKTDAMPPALQNQKVTETQRIVFRSSADSEYGKRLRWDLETIKNKIAENKIYSRNDVLNDHVSLIENKDGASTDLLQEYFIPVDHFDQFIEGIKPILRDSKIDLLNITIRGVCKDADSFMNYAREDVFGFVILFNQKKTAAQEIEMQKLTNQLVDVALHNRGTFYLPYRLHIDRDKMRKSYPQADDFFRFKLKYDPREIFSNKFYEHYR